MKHHPMRCRCGSLQGHVVRPGPSVRLVCHCRDCQAFAHFLRCADSVLDENGGTAIVAARPGQVHFSQGLEHLACMSLSDQGMFRWYAACCSTPIGNTPRDFRMSYVGLLEACLETDPPSLQPSFGAVRMQLCTEQARGPVASSRLGNFLGLLAIMRSVLGARLSGAYKTNPFFVLQGSEPIVVPRVLSEAERAQVTPEAASAEIR